MKQSEIAKEYGIDRTALNKILNGRFKKIPLETAIKLSKILKMPTEKISGADPSELKRRFFELHEF